jgi:glycosyltransferase involved in cell wall biosynthesis
MVEECFSRAFSRRGYQPKPIPLPESIKSTRALQEIVGPDIGNVVHIAFRSAERLRLVASARNICHFAWEFDVLKDHNLVAEHVTHNQVHMLGLFDEIWVPCRYTRDVLFRHGLTKVHVVPTPICEDAPRRLRRTEALQVVGAVPSLPLLLTGLTTQENGAEIVGPNIAALERHLSVLGNPARSDGRIFLTVCNPHDWRKNLLNLIEGFQLVNDITSRDVLIVKLIVSNRGDFRRTSLRDDFLRLYHGPRSEFDPNIIFIFDYLTADRMTALYSLADFYVSASHCEGFNLPLLEAMAVGTAAISTRNTAMLDYLHDDNSVPISEKSYPGPIPGMAGDIAGTTYDVAVATRFDIARGIQRASAMSSDERDRLAQRGRADVVEKYSAEKIIRDADARLSCLFYGSERENAA